MLRHVVHSTTVLHMTTHRHIRIMHRRLCLHRRVLVHGLHGASHGLHGTSHHGCMLHRWRGVGRITLKGGNGVIGLSQPRLQCSLALLEGMDVVLQPLAILCKVILHPLALLSEVLHLVFLHLELIFEVRDRDPQIGAPSSATPSPPPSPCPAT